MVGAKSSLNSAVDSIPDRDNTQGSNDHINAHTLEQSRSVTEGEIEAVPGLTHLKE